MLLWWSLFSQKFVWIRDADFPCAAAFLPCHHLPNLLCLCSASLWFQKHHKSSSCSCSSGGLWCCSRCSRVRMFHMGMLLEMSGNWSGCNPLTLMHLLLSRHPAHCCCCLEKLLLVSVMLSGDLVAAWDLDLSDGVHRIQFSHGTTTGKRLVCVNGQVRSKFTL